MSRLTRSVGQLLLFVGESLTQEPTVDKPARRPRSRREDEAADAVMPERRLRSGRGPRWTDDDDERACSGCRGLQFTVAKECADGECFHRDCPEIPCRLCTPGQTYVQRASEEDIKERQADVKARRACEHHREPLVSRADVGAFFDWVDAADDLLREVLGAINKNTQLARRIRTHLGMDRAGPWQRLLQAAGERRRRA